MRAFVSDQSSSFNAKVINGSPDGTIVASLDLPPGSRVIFATVALAGNAAPGATVNVQMFFELDSKIYVGGNQCVFAISGTVNGFQIIPLTTGLVLDTPKTLQIVCFAIFRPTCDADQIAFPATPNLIKGDCEFERSVMCNLPIAAIVLGLAVLVIWTASLGYQLFRVIGLCFNRTIRPRFCQPQADSRGKSLRRLRLVFQGLSR